MGSGVRELLGIPFGNAPIGEGRFRRATAAPAPDWSGLSNSYDTFGPAPIQSRKGMLATAVPGMDPGPVSEDCLTLNVWSPAAVGERLAVMVWLYGGAFIVGGSAAPTYHGAKLAAEQNVVVVSINYRVGAFGFLDLRGVPGGDTADTNCGSHDQLLGLRWVHDHIAALGGDPDRVTVFGESGGAGSIMHLLTTPGLTSIVRRAIVQSPGVDFTQRAATSSRVTAALLHESGATSVADLRALTADEMLTAQTNVANQLMFEVGTMVFHPVVDDVFVTTTPTAAVAAGATDDLDLLIGFTSDEMRLFPDPRADALGRDGLARWTRQYLTSRMAADPGSDIAEGLVGEYIDRAVGTNRPNGSDVWAQISTDGIMRLPVVRILDSRVGPAATFAYLFAWQARRTDRDVGAFHAIDLPFTFDTFEAGAVGDMPGWGEFIGIDDAGRAAGLALRTAWASFASTGDPTCAPTGQWPAYDATSRQTMVLDVFPHVVSDPLETERGWWEGLWNRNCRPPGVAL